MGSRSTGRLDSRNDRQGQKILDEQAQVIVTYRALSGHRVDYTLRLPDLSRARLGAVPFEETQLDGQPMPVLRGEEYAFTGYDYTVYIGQRPGSTVGANGGVGVLLDGSPLLPVAALLGTVALVGCGGGSGDEAGVEAVTTTTATATTTTAAPATTAPLDYRSAMAQRLTEEWGDEALATQIVDRLGVEGLADWEAKVPKDEVLTTPLLTYQGDGRPAEEIDSLVVFASATGEMSRPTSSPARSTNGWPKRWRSSWPTIR